MPQENNELQMVSSRGTITYAADVLAVIAGLAASDIPGVAGMSRTLGDGIAELLGKKNLGKGVKVEVGNQEVAVDMSVIVNYGVQIPEVCAAAQASVKRALETMTSLKCVEVNVVVQGIQFEKEQDLARVK